jgi:hypothetical protein
VLTAIGFVLLVTTTAGRWGARDAAVREPG